MRNLARFLVSEGSTVFLSSHLKSEILALATGAAVQVRTPGAERFGALLAAPDITIAHR